MQELTCNRLWHYKARSDNQFVGGDCRSHDYCKRHSCNEKAGACVFIFDFRLFFKMMNEHKNSIGTRKLPVQRKILPLNHLSIVYFMFFAVFGYGLCPYIFL